MGADGEKRIVLVSSLAFYPYHWEALRAICRDYRATATVLAFDAPELPSVHQQIGWVADHDDWKPDVRTAPHGGSRTWLAEQIRTVRPDAIWVQEEPTDYRLLEVLRVCWWQRRTRIVAAVCENIFAAAPLRLSLVRRTLWHRLDCLVAVATPSIDGIRRVGMPRRVEAIPLVAGAGSPPEHVPDAPPLLPPGTFIVGFAGRIVAEKGWRVLAEAVAQLPPRIGLAIAGDGADADELRALLAADARLARRTTVVGLLPKAEMWSFYARLDCLAVPSLTTPTWKEQFGGVVADGLAAGLPVIGSSSGSIPEVLGEAGIVVPEGDAQALAAAIARLAADPSACADLSQRARRRFDGEFAIDRYAAKLARALGLEPRRPGPGR